MLTRGMLIRLLQQTPSVFDNLGVERVPLSVTLIFIGRTEIVFPASRQPLYLRIPNAFS